MSTTTILIVAGAGAAFALAAWYGWNRWFRDSEVNVLADAMTYVGLLAEIMIFFDDPGINELLTEWGFKPSSLIVFGIVIRLARRLRDQSMSVTEPSVAAAKGDAAEAAETEQTTTSQ